MQFLIDLRTAVRILPNCFHYQEHKHGLVFDSFIIFLRGCDILYHLHRKIKSWEGWKVEDIWQRSMSKVKIIKISHIWWNLLWLKDDEKLFTILDGKFDGHFPIFTIDPYALHRLSVHGKMTNVP